ncbi:MAG TPA: aminopeptidase [Gaiellales bacterium]|nr:aminopeptidase [Gaiellales bacterium]
MSDRRVENLARVICEYSLQVKPGQLMLIQSPALAEPLVLELVKSALRLGANPRVLLEAEGTQVAYLSEAGDQQLSTLLPNLLPMWEAIDLRVTIHASWNTRELSGIDPARMATVQRARAPLMETGMRRSAAGEMRWCVTAYPCEAFAQDADMSLAGYEDFVYGAGWLGLDEPVAVWRAFAGKLREVVDRLAGVRELRVLGEDTDLTVGVAGRTWKPCAGDRNFPDGEVFTAPLETETRGDVRFSFPAIYGGREVQDVRLRFEGGRVVRSEAAAGADLLRKMLEIDDGASILGEFAIGTNYAIEQFTKQILFDEKIGGTCHMAVGAGYPETGSTNRSGLHWDMVCDLRSGGEIHADGELIYRDGRFLPEFAPDLSPPGAE